VEVTAEKVMMVVAAPVTEVMADVGMAVVGVGGAAQEERPAASGGSREPPRGAEQP
jgi:hypothetical protein